MNQHTPQNKNPETDAMAQALMATREDADQEALDRLMRHSRRVSAAPAKRGLSWGWVALPMAVAGVAAAVALTANPTAPSGEAPAPAIAAVEAPAASDLETELAAVIDAQDEMSGAQDLGPFESIAGFDKSGAQEGDWLAPGFDSEDSEELDDWITAYEQVLAEG